MKPTLSEIVQTAVGLSARPSKKDAVAFANIVNGLARRGPPPKYSRSPYARAWRLLIKYGYSKA